MISCGTSYPISCNRFVMHGLSDIPLSIYIRRPPLQIVKTTGGSDPSSADQGGSGNFFRREYMY